MQCKPIKLRVSLAEHMCSCDHLLNTSNVILPTASLPLSSACPPTLHCHETLLATILPSLLASVVLVYFIFTFS
jgi:hypothetical protein